MKERDIEIYLRDQIKQLGGVAYKFVSPGNAGVPDRLVLLPRGRVVFVELKARGKESTPLQMRQQERITNLGFDVRTISSFAAIDCLVQELKSK